LQSRQLGEEHERVKAALEEAYRMWEELGDALQEMDGAEAPNL
jgi:hypothetical protein